MTLVNGTSPFLMGKSTINLDDDPPSLHCFVSFFGGTLPSHDRSQEHQHLVQQQQQLLAQHGTTEPHFGYPAWLCQVIAIENAHL